MDGAGEPHHADRSLVGKVRRRITRLRRRRSLDQDLAKGWVTFSFDDAPKSAAVLGAQILEARGVRGAYFVSAGLAGQQSPMGAMAEPDDYRRLAQAGHEIACHTFPHLDCGKASAEAVRAAVDRNAAAFAAWGLTPPRTFAYPYGEVAVAAKQVLSSRFALMRAVHKGLLRRGTDLNQVPGVGVEGPGGEAVGRRWLAAVAAQGGWLILFTHDVQDHPSPWGCTPETLAALVDMALELGLDVVTAAEGARRLGLG